MNTERIIEDQVELYVLEQQMPLTYADPLRNALRRAVEQARQQEREACAKVCEDSIGAIFEFSDEIVKETARNVCINLAKGIKARGNE